MKESIIKLVTATTILSGVFFISSIFDITFLPLAFYVWNLLPVVLIIDFTAWGVYELFNKLKKENNERKRTKY